MKTIGLIPARGGSKRIPIKNIRVLNGKPLIYWICKAAQESNLDMTYVSTEDAEIKAIVDGFGFSKIRTIARNLSTCTDEASTISVIDDFSQRIEWDELAIMQAPCPLLRSEDISGALEYIQGFDSIVCAVKQNRFIWKNGKANYDISNRPRGQDSESYAVEVGCCYITKKDNYEKNHNFIGGNIGMYELSEEMYFEIDSADDFKIVELIMKSKIEMETPSYYPAEQMRRKILSL